MQPMGDRSNAIFFGTVAATLVNVHLKKGARPYNWQDFFPPLAEQKTAEEMLRVVEQLNAFYGGRDLREK